MLNTTFRIRGAIAIYLGCYIADVLYSKGAIQLMSYILCMLYSRDAISHMAYIAGELLVYSRGAI